MPAALRNVPKPPARVIRRGSRILRGAPTGVQFDAVGPSSAGQGQTGTATPITWSHTCTGSNRALLVGVVIAGTDTGVTTTVTYNGVTVPTVVKRHSNDSTSGYAELFALAGPATGTNTVSVAVAGSGWEGFEGGSVSFTGVDQTTPVAHSATAVGNSAFPSVTVASTAGNMVCDLACAGTDVTGSPGTSRWLLNRNQASAAGNAGQATDAGAASVVMARTLLGADFWAAIAADVQAAAAVALDPAPTFHPITQLAGYY